MPWLGRAPARNCPRARKRAPGRRSFRSHCGRVYRRAFLDRIGFSFVDKVIFEDILAHFQLLLVARTVVLVDEPVYFYRVGHQGQITDRKDHTIFDILPVLNRIIDELWKHSATAEVWANFIFLQSWVMLWLCSQIADKQREMLISGFAKIALKFPPRGLIRFRQKFRHDAQASMAVGLQLFGDTDLFEECAENRGCLRARQEGGRLEHSATILHRPGATD